MENDLDTPGAVDLMFRLVREANTALDTGDRSAASAAAAAVLEIAAAFGLELEGRAAAVPPQIQELADRRTAARSAKDYALADELRDQLAAAGWTVEDSAEGAVVLPLP